MRIEIAGAQITETVVEVLDSLQNERGVADQYIGTLDAITRTVIVNLSGDNAEADSRVLSQLKTLQKIRRDILTLADPPDVDDPENDIPTASF